MWNLILMLAAGISRQHKAHYTQTATFTLVEPCSQVFTGSVDESEQKTMECDLPDVLLRLSLTRSASESSHFKTDLSLCEAISIHGIHNIFH